MSNFVKKNVMQACTSAFDVDESDPTVLLRTDKVYFGAKFDMLIAQRGSRLTKEALHDVQKNCLSFYQELARQIKMRINHKDEFLQGLTCVDPEVAVSGDVPSIIPMFERFGETLPLIDIEDLNTEWRRLSMEPDLMENFHKFIALNKRNPQKRRRSRKRAEKLPVEVVELEGNLLFPFINLMASDSSLFKCPDAFRGVFSDDDYEQSSDCESENDDSDVEPRPSEDPRPDCYPKDNRIDPAAFWSFVRTIKDGRGQPQFSNVCQFMEVLMTMPHSSASAERKFSRLKIFKTPLRNKLGPATLNSMFHTQRFVPKVSEWTVPQSIVSQSKNWKSISSAEV